MPATKPKLPDQVRSYLRTLHYSRRTEDSYCEWMKRFILFPSSPLVPKVGEALWERTREAKLRFGRGQVSMGTAIEVVTRQNGDGVSPG